MSRVVSTANVRSGTRFLAVAILLAAPYNVDAGVEALALSLPDRLGSLRIGVSTRDDALQLLGEPSSSDKEFVNSVPLQVDRYRWDVTLRSELKAPQRVHSISLIANYQTVEVPRLGTIVAGESTRAEALALLGEPQIYVEDKRRRTWRDAYSFVATVKSRNVATQTVVALELIRAFAAAGFDGFASAMPSAEVERLLTARFGAPQRASADRVEIEVAAEPVPVRVEISYLLGKLAKITMQATIAPTEQQEAQHAAETAAFESRRRDRIERSVTQRERALLRGGYTPYITTWQLFVDDGWLFEPASGGQIFVTGVSCVLDGIDVRLGYTEQPPGTSVYSPLDMARLRPTLQTLQSGFCQELDYNDPAEEHPPAFEACRLTFNGRRQLTYNGCLDLFKN